MLPPRDLVDRLERAPSLPEGESERFRGYGVMGMPFESGHVLALRRFAASSIGEGYTSVWHRDPQGKWIFYTTLPAHLGCPRFFGLSLAGAVETDVEITWPGPFELSVSVPGADLSWVIKVEPTPSTRIMNSAARLLPERAWRNRTVLSMVARVAGPLLGVGHVGLHGLAPNGQHFIANPRQLWMVTRSSANSAGEDFGLPRPLDVQARLGDFWIPQRGILAIGESLFEPFDPSRHSASSTAA